MGNPYSSKTLRGGDQLVKLAVPTLPGDYELRYISNPGAQRILVAETFRSIEPALRIEAPDTVVAGGTFAVRIIGDVSSNTNVTIVPMDSPDNLLRTHVYLKGGADETATFRKIPAEPGPYEIRIVTSWGAGMQVYARKALTIQ